MLLGLMRIFCWFVDHEWLTFDLLGDPMRFCARCGELEKAAR